MKVVLFCGGLGMRLREYSDDVPKPMVPIGYRPILWHVMKYYAHFGFKDFILCLGYKSDVIKRYFVEYKEFLSNDFVLSNGGMDIELLNRDIHDWKITFVDTGVNTSIGQRLKAVEHLVRDEEVFMANYTDGLTDADLSYVLDEHMKHGKTGTMLCVRPRQSFHVVDIDQSGGLVQGIKGAGESGLWVNGGYFVFRPKIFDYIGPHEDLVGPPLQSLIEEEELVAYQHRGFWAGMDTFKDKQELEGLHANGQAPWELWRPGMSSVNGMGQHGQVLPAA